ncbi:wall-associated receptor kinase-like 1 [Ziziphus jujuba]|uniref:Wall-associated receptor kinase-like 1 n=1 Tax=Ziziphus jujuba TaxID=326968 RepID=A0ABM3IHH9_ZIZJJ|nr:wall-associated receptor kinase-like 1 [Ziziphus jujuba]
MMGKQFTFYLLLLFSWLMMNQVASEIPTARNGCPSHCGNVSIPFPFGIKPGCFLDERFEIICQNNNSSNTVPKPILNRTKLEVIEISVEGTFQVRNPITFWNCSGKQMRESTNLEGSPFKYSQNNKFAAVGCGAIALMNSGEASIGGCSSICNDTAYGNSCNGINCCQTTMPSNLKSFNTSFLDLPAEGSGNQCKFAFMADQRNSSCNVYIVNVNQPRLQCSCGQWSFEGNPYLLEGCKDINVCKKDPNYCGEGYICTDYPGGVGCSLPERKKSPLKAILIGVGSGVLGLLFLSASAWLLTKYIKKRRREKFFKQNGGLLLQQQLSSGEANIEKTKLFKSDELEKATDQFNMNRVLGKGGQGTVYKKKSKKVDTVKVTEFINEIVILSQINHRNVVKLLGCCLETEVPLLLVYEFIPNGTLFRYIHYQNEDFQLTWETCLRIAKEIAGALSYLHSATSFPIYHRDIKSSNILLDEKYRAKIADFGTSRSVTIEQTHLTTIVYGTFGYLDPEYFQSSQFTDKSDVYSFGVVLAELLTGRKPVFMQAEEGGSLAASFILSMEENCLFDIVDAPILKEATGEKEAIMAVAKLAKRCLDLSGRKRPSMKEVAMELERIQKSIKASDYVVQNVEVVEYDGNEMTAPWDDVSISTWSASYGGIASSSDMEAPLNEKHMVTYK